MNSYNPFKEFLEEIPLLTIIWSALYPFFLEGKKAGSSFLVPKGI